MSEKQKGSPTGEGHRPVSVQADPALTPGTYSNLAMITHRREEFVLDFLFVQPQTAPQGSPTALLQARVISSPSHTKRVLRALEENVRRYEAQFGPIDDSEPAGLLQ
jgi:hypothetical protein